MTRSNGYKTSRAGEKPGGVGWSKRRRRLAWQSRAPASKVPSQAALSWLQIPPPERTLLQPLFFGRGTLSAAGDLLERLSSAILKGVDLALFVTELNRMGRRKSELEAELAAVADEKLSALLHPRLAQVYRAKVERLLETFESEGGRTEAQEIIRSLIDAVVITPTDGVLHAEVKGDLATMLVLASETHRAPEACASEARQVKLVAGTRTERCNTPAIIEV